MARREPSGTTFPCRFFRVALVCWSFLAVRPAAAQEILDFPLSSAGIPADIASGPDGALWFTVSNRIGRITTGGVMSDFVTGQVSNPAGIVAGPDGALWFCNQGTSKIGRLTTTGTLTQFPAAGSPKSIAVGPDGNLWFTEPRINKIGRMTTSGGFTDFAIPTANALPEAIAAGPDGNLWFTEFATHSIGRITTSGTVTEFPVLTSSPGLSGIVLGPDGNLWFTESNVSKVGRITTSGTVKEFPLPETTRTFRIASGSDGNLWLTLFDSNKIARLTTSGGVTEFLIPTANSKPYGIASGPDGNLWFTEFTGDKIGKVVPPAPTPGASFYPLTPCRVIDTRRTDGDLGGPALVAGTGRLFTLAGTCGIPSNVRGITVNATVTQGAAAGALTIYPATVSMPATANLNYGAGQTRANNAILSPDGAGSVIVHCDQSSGTVQFILDVTGYFK